MCSQSSHCATQPQLPQLRAGADVFGNAVSLHGGQLLPDSQGICGKWRRPAVEGEKKGISCLQVNGTREIVTVGKGRDRAAQ